MHEYLVLFDIDGTLIDARGAGLEAIRQAARDLHGGEIPPLDLRGSTDAGLARTVLEFFGLEVDESAVFSFYEAYLVRLQENLASEAFAGRILPGVCELLEALSKAGATLGLLTGNIEPGAALKMKRFGLWGHFRFGAFGDRHPDRNELGPVALERARESEGRTFSPKHTVIVGDTPKDIACGRSLGARTVAVATGSYSAEELRAHGATLVVESFRDPAVVIAGLRGDSNKGN